MVDRELVRRTMSRSLTGTLLAMAIVGGTSPVACAYTGGKAADNWQFAADLYGRGVHAFFACHYYEASQFFDQAINTGVQDPRPYYFRGVTKMKMGDDASADADFEMGATMEAKSRGTYDMGMALIRVQGPVRHQLEQVRRRGLATAVQIQGTGDGHYSPSDVTPGATADPGELIAPDMPAEATDPFADDAQEPVAKEVPRPKPPAPAEVDDSSDMEVNPFAEDEPSADEAPADTSPDKTKPAPAEPADEDPFGLDAFGSDAGDEDPF